MGLGTLRDLSERLVAASDESAMVEVLQTYCAETFSLHTVWLYVLRDSEPISMRLQSVAGRHAVHLGQNMPSIVVPGDPMLEALAEGVGPVYLNEDQVRSNNPEIHALMQNRAVLATPVISLDSRLGVIGAGAFKDDAPPPVDQDTLDEFALVGSLVAAALSGIFKRRHAEAQARIALERARVESVQLMANGLVHDFRNMLHVMRSCASLLESTRLDASQRQDLAALRDAAERAQEIAEQLLVLGSGRKPKTEVAKAADLVDEAVTLVRPRLSPGLTLLASGPTSPPSVSVERSGIVRVIVNLLTNAADACGQQGQISVTVRRAPTIEESWPPPPEGVDGPFVRIGVRDSGSGIDPTALEHVFEPYFSTKPSERGAGLGLAVSLAIVASHGGHIACASTPGEGSVFAIYLPTP